MSNKSLLATGVASLVFGLVFAAVAWAGVPCQNDPGNSLVIPAGGGCVASGLPFQAWTVPVQTGGFSYSIYQGTSPITHQSGSTDGAGVMTISGQPLLAAGTYSLAVTINGVTVCESFCVL